MKTHIIFTNHTLWNGLTVLRLSTSVNSCINTVDAVQNNNNLNKFRKNHSIPITMHNGFY